MSTKGKRLIFVGPVSPTSPNPLKHDAIAKAAVLPGTILKNTSTGLEAKADAATVFGNKVFIADKNQMQSKSVDDAWTINESMVACVPRSGEMYNVLVATGQALVEGDPLVSNGAGLLVKGSGASTQSVICNAAETVTTTATQLVTVSF